ncbi:MAG TPA: hypothetical protein VFA09_26870 [Ktedonobacteraceae bacterium]|nr:hypothetical protein [Ktedonobacteraceae bacterium]
MRRRRPEENLDVYQYDVLPDTFRRQVIHILVDTLGVYRDGRYSSLSLPSANGRWETLFSRYTREMGIFHLENDPDANPYEQCLRYIQAAPTEQTLDFIDCAFQFIDRDLRQDSEYIVHVPGRGYQVRLVDEAIVELNQRFQEHHIGYQFQNGELIKQTDQYLHEEVVLPALTLLTGPQFRGAQDEFLSAHRHYREQRYKEAVADALKAFESTMKSILDDRGWHYERERDTARNLLQILFDHQLIPAMLQSQFTQLRGLLESGLLPVRNRTSGHGQGAEPVALPKYIAEYALHVAAANIVFLVQAYEDFKQSSK